jgi:protein-glutamine gamma-glutamyltransferase
MSFASLYRGSFYLMMVFSTLVLSIDATDNKLSMLYPVAVAVAGLVAFLTVDHRPSLGISPSFGGLLALGVTGLTVIEWMWDRNLLLLALGHWLVYLQLIYMFRSKTVETDWWMFILSLVQVMVGSVLSQSDSVGMMLFGWALLALWVLGLFSLQRDAIRARDEAGGDAGRSVADAPAPGGELYPGLFNFPFVLSAARVTLTTLALGGVIFLAMPRQPGMARSLRGQGHAQHLTGFDDEVQLGQLGEILENDSVVMSVELFDEHDQRIVPTAGQEFRWRGATLWSYESGRWKRLRRQTAPYAWFEAGGIGLYRPESADEKVIRQQIKLEANDSSVLFALRPLLDASSRRSGPEFNPLDGTIFRNDLRPGQFDYEVRSYLNENIPQPGEKALSEAPYLKLRLLDVPERLLPRLRTIAEGVIADYARSHQLTAEGAKDVRTRAKALEWYLRDSGQFGYTLKLDVIDGNLDPVEDFLVNRKEGHCEYFASALALMLRSVGIPARLVNGFKGGDWNDLARILSVRQKHAHSWVEAYLGDEPIQPGGPVSARDRRAIWLTLDPTPGQERERSVAQVGGFGGRFRQITDLIRYVWVFYIVGYDAERQNRLLYAPIRALMLEAQRGFRLMADWAQIAWAKVLQLLHFPSTREFFSARGFLVAFVALGVLYGLGWLALFLARRMWARLMGAEEDASSLAAGAAQYRRLTLLLAGYGLERMPAETQAEFARRATGALTGPGTNRESVADVPRLVVEAFYRVRFGRRELSEPTVASLEAQLDALEASLRANQG